MSRIVFAPDSFKGTIDAVSAARALARGWRRARPHDELVLRPMADGGEGTLDAFALAVPGAERMPVTVTGPDGRPVRGDWLRMPGAAPDAGDLALVELASTSGITLLERLAPFDAHTLGFGEAIAAALDARASGLLLAIGGSASSDGGAGALRALGAVLQDDRGRDVPLGNRGLAVLERVELGGVRSLPAAGASILSDVVDPLLGPHGAAALFGPQKGASPEELPRLEAALARWADRLAAAGAPGLVDPDASGAGAAGGTGFGLLAWGAGLVGGAGAVAAAIDLPDAARGADLVVAGEGRFDATSLHGKAPGLVAATARDAGAPAALVAGAIAEEAAAAAAAGFAVALSLTELAGGEAAARAEPERWLELAGERLARAS